MGISVGAAIDYLVSGTSPSLGLTLSAMLASVDSTALLSDNDPSQFSQSMVFIGRADPSNAEAGTGSRQYIELGAGRSQEDYSIPCYISVTRDGPAQKPARDAAIALFDVVAKFVHSDLTLGGVLLQGRSAYISSVTLTQTRDETDTAGGALRVAWLMFYIHASNYYNPSI